MKFYPSCMFVHSKSTPSNRTQAWPHKQWGLMQDIPMGPPLSPQVPPLTTQPWQEKCLWCCAQRVAWGISSDVMGSPPTASVWRQGQVGCHFYEQLVLYDEQDGLNLASSNEQLPHSTHRLTTHGNPGCSSKRSAGPQSPM